MLNLDLDIIYLLNDEMFSKNYELKDAGKEDKLAKIRS